jgi:hypothetical protein
LNNDLGTTGSKALTGFDGSHNPKVVGSNPTPATIEK